MATGTSHDEPNVETTSEIVPEGEYLTYGVSVSLSEMRDPAAAQARTPVTQGERSR